MWKAMKSFDLPLAFGMSKSADWLDSSAIESASTYREAVRACWAHRRIHGMTQRTAAELIGMYPSHVSDYLSEEDGKRNLPAEKIAAFEALCGNRAITQWEMRQRGLTIMEEVIARRAA